MQYIILTFLFLKMVKVMFHLYKTSINLDMNMFHLLLQINLHQILLINISKTKNHKKHIQIPIYHP